MKCVGYDAAWQQFLVENYQTWQLEYEACQAAKKTNGGQVLIKRRGSRKEPVTKKQRLSRLPNFDGDIPSPYEPENSDVDSVMEVNSSGKAVKKAKTFNENYHEVDEEDGSEADVLRHMARGTRSRPKAGPRKAGR